MHAEDGLQLERNPLHIRAEDELKTMSPSDERILERFPFPSCRHSEGISPSKGLWSQSSGGTFAASEKFVTLQTRMQTSRVGRSMQRKWRGGEDTDGCITIP